MNRDAATAAHFALRAAPWTIERTACFVIRTTAVR
jgi:hypothetical protein